MMKIYLKKLATQLGTQQSKCIIENRLPPFVISPCSLMCTYEVQAQDDYFILQLDIKGEVYIECSRCLQPFLYHYKDQFKLAICERDDRSESLMADYDCIVSPTLNLDLVDVVTDCLYLGLPEKHDHIDDCDTNMKKYLVKSED